jgi:hypothetical protein
VSICGVVASAFDHLSEPKIQPTVHSCPRSRLYKQLSSKRIYILWGMTRLELGIHLISFDQLVEVRILTISRPAKLDAPFLGVPLKQFLTCCLCFMRFPPLLFSREPTQSKQRQDKGGNWLPRRPQLRKRTRKTGASIFAGRVSTTSLPHTALTLAAQRLSFIVKRKSHTRIAR